MRNSPNFLKSFDKLSDFFDHLDNRLSGNIKSIIFDLDGTLVHSEPLHAHAGLQALKAVGANLQKIPTVEESVAQFKGKSDYIVIEELKTMGVIDRAIEADHFVALKNQQLVEILKQTPRQKVMPDEYFNFLMGLKKKYTVAIVTASERAVLDGCLKYWELSKVFPFTLSRDEVPRSKPHPDPYLEAFRHLKVQPTQTVIVEDSETGQEAAFKSGAFWIEAKWYE